MKITSEDIAECGSNVFSVVLSFENGDSCEATDVQSGATLSGSDLGSCKRFEAEPTKMKIITEETDSKCFGNMEVKLEDGTQYGCNIETNECTIIKLTTGEFYL